ncbi:unnamed protein product [Owenia fusiformis]|uniref:Growth arrest-specific protein 1 n=1 Tax=Owenia fusiformis TaxID=6347 RepID=A0A8S4PQK8_OWEFU|nr:unnamed protein product [Owenia fusiformis]
MTLIHQNIAFGLSVFICTLTSLAAELCHVARNKCVARMGCSMALHNYITNCGPVIHGETDICTPDCRKALISLFSTDDKAGEMFMTCDCNGNQFCEESKHRIEICSNDVIQGLHSIDDDETMLSCSLASMICEADTRCCTALDFYQLHCKKMWAGEKCTHRCNNSIQILYGQHKAKKLRTCYCDGTEGLTAGSSGLLHIYPLDQPVHALHYNSALNDIQCQASPDITQPSKMAMAQQDRSPGYEFIFTKFET